MAVSASDCATRPLCAHSSLISNCREETPHSHTREVTPHPNEWR